MATEEIDLVDQILGGAAADPAEKPQPDAIWAKQPDDAQAKLHDAVQSKLPDDTYLASSDDTNFASSDDAEGKLLPDDAPVADAPKRGLRLHLPFRRLPNPFRRLPNPFSKPLAWVGSRRGRRWQAAGFALAFVLGATTFLGVSSGAAAVAFNASSQHVVPGVHVGAADLSGLTRDQAVARLNSAYAYLSQGEVTVTTPSGTETLTYQQLGRAPNSEFMADQAMQIGHSGNAIGDAVAMLRAGITGRSVPIVVRIDPSAVATSVRQLTSANKLPQDAQATTESGMFSTTPAVSGLGLNETAICNAIIDHLTQPDAPAKFDAGGALLELRPSISDKEAQAAIDTAKKMVVEIHLTANQPASASASAATPAASSSIKPLQTYTISTDKVFGWIVFGKQSDGTYGPAVDLGRIQSTLAGLTPQVLVAPHEPKVVMNASNAPIDVVGGADGLGIDVASTARLIQGYLNKLATGGQPASSLDVMTAPIKPKLTKDSLNQLVGIGHWTTTFYPDVSNGNGTNIRLPSSLLNGQVVGPGEQFDFLNAVGPIDLKHGYKMGGVIEQGVSNHTGAIGGGICSMSTTMFNAAAMAGLQIDERHAHFYYIDRYPVGRDATVYSNGGDSTWNLKWTNDTPNPILIVSISTYGSTSTVTVALWSLPLDRTTTWSGGLKSNVSKAIDTTVYTTKLAPGDWGRQEFPSDGFDTTVTRTVLDPNLKVIHNDTWTSHYARVDGILLKGIAPTPPPAPTPTPV
jgi:vancomycin resistance protein YoaR